MAAHNPRLHPRERLETKAEFMDREEWFETWFDTRYYHILYGNRDELEARQFIDALLRFLAPPPGARFLDVACGRGRHAINLHQYGYEVTGIDLSANNIAEALKYASGSLHFYLRDIREPLNVGLYDYALNLFTSFGYFDDVEEHIRAISNIAGSLKPGGQLVLDYLNIDYVRQHLIHEEFCEKSGVYFNLSRSLDAPYLYKHIQVREGDNIHCFEERVMAFTQKDLCAMLEKGGLTPTRCFGNYALDPCTPNQPRVIIIAQNNP